MICNFCGKKTPNNAAFCPYCGKRIDEQTHSKKKRGNGQGSVYKRGNLYVAAKTLGYYLDENGKKHRKVVRKSFEKKKDAIAALPTLGGADKAPKLDATFREVYDLWFPTITAGKSTQNCYAAAFKHFRSLWFLPASEIEIDDLQECMDSCPYGKRTRQNMKTTAGLIYKYGIPRGYFPDKLNLSSYLLVRGENGAGGVGLPMDYLAEIEKKTSTVSGADLVMANCYLGFRPSEFLALKPENYNASQKAFVGGAKTDAGKDRTVTISPKIQGIVDKYSGRNMNQFFCAPDGKTMDIKAYRELFYSVLDELGLDNPMIEVSGIKRHTYTPHSCRHTFATLMKRVAGNSKDKLELIGHSSEEMLRYYQDAPLDDLRKITDLL